MKRVPSIDKPEHGIRRIYPRIFWKKCHVCGMEVKKEYMWKAFIENIWDTGGGYNVFEYFCMSCCPTVEKAIVLRHEIRGEKEDENRKYEYL